MTQSEALKILDFTTEAHAKLWLDNRMIGPSAILMDGVYTLMELEAILVLVRGRNGR